MVSGKWWLNKPVFPFFNNSAIVKAEERGGEGKSKPSTQDWAFLWHSPVCALLAGTSEVSTQHAALLRTALSSSLSPADSSSEDELQLKKHKLKRWSTHPGRELTIV